MRRILGAVLVGLGALLVVLAIGLPVFLGPRLAQIPSTLQVCNPGSRTEPAGCLPPVTAKASDATYLQLSETGGHVKIGDLTTIVEVVPKTKLTADAIAAKKIPDSAQIWYVYSTTKDAAGVIIAQSSARIAIDRKTGAAVDWSDQQLEDGTDEVVAFSGNEYQFPFGTEKKTYAVYDDNVKATRDALFTGTETIDGLETYHFVLEVKDEKLSLTRDNMSSLRLLFAPNASDGTVTYSVTRELWIDPVTGVIVKLRDHQTKTYKGNDGTTQVLLDGDFKSIDSEVKEAADKARTNGMNLKIFTVYAPVGLGIVGLVLVLAGFLLLRAPRPSAAGDGPGWNDALAEPRHRLRGDEAETVADAPSWPRQ